MVNGTKSMIFLKGRAPKSKRPQSNSSNAAPVTNMHKGSPIPFYIARGKSGVHTGAFSFTNESKNKKPQCTRGVGLWLTSKGFVIIGISTRFPGRAMNWTFEKRQTDILQLRGNLYKQMFLFKSGLLLGLDLHWLYLQFEAIGWHTPQLWI